jgi:hypothetical protein
LATSKVLRFPSDRVPAAIKNPVEYTGMECYGLSRKSIPDAKRAEVREAWPVNQPTFWTPEDFPGFSKLFNSVQRAWIASTRGGNPPSKAPLYPVEFSGRLGLHEAGQIYELPLVWTARYDEPNSIGLAYCYRSGPNFGFQKFEDSSGKFDPTVWNKLVRLSKFSAPSGYAWFQARIFERDEFFLNPETLSFPGHHGGR